MATITTLLFDFGGTLDGPAHWLDRFLASYRAAGVEISRAELDPAFDEATRIGYGATRVVARFGLTDLVRFLVGHQFEYLRKRRSRRAPQSTRRLRSRGTPSIWSRPVTNSFVRETSAGLAHSRNIVGALKSRFKLGIVSNFYGNLDRILEEAKLDRFFAAVADSSRVGIFKPDPGIFEAALKKLQCAPRSAAMVGDSISQGLRTRPQTRDAHSMAAHWIATR